METGATSFNVWLKQRRRAFDLTQEDLAERVGCSTITIQKIELGERRPSKQVALRLAECLLIPEEEQEDFLRFARGERRDEQGPKELGGQALPTTVVADTPAVIDAPLTTPNNLPIPLTSLVGRESALEAACDYLLRPDIRLLTLTGVPGIGKTRLSLAVAAHLLSEFRDGVFFVELAAIGEPGLVASAIATTLGCKELAGGSHLEWLKQFIRDRRLLLVLDNFEQVLDAAPLVMELLMSCPALRVLVTSREALHIMGEQQFTMQPLDVPDASHLAGIDDRQTVLSYPSVELFVQRAGSVDPGFALTEGNERVVAAICTRLEGLPLAIELAAARIKMLTPDDIFSRLDRRMMLLTGGAKHLPPRLQTLRGAIDWSYRLLTPDEQSLFNCLGVFVGGASLSAIQAVWGEQNDSLDVLEGVGSLVDKNLLKREANRSRFTMLEMVREYAQEKLSESNQGEATRWAHARYFLGLAEEADLKAEGPQESVALDRLEEEHDNLRSALQWFLSSRAGADGARSGLRLALLLGRLWYVRGYLSEGRERLATALSIASAAGNTHELKSLRAWTLQRVGNLSFLQADYRATRAALEEALDLFEEIGEKKGIAFMLKDLADTAREEGDYDTATAQFEQSLSLLRELDERPGTMATLVLMSQAEMRRGFHAQATTHLEEALQIAKERQDPGGVAFALASLGEAMTLQGEYEKANRLLEESLMISRDRGQPWFIAASLGSLAWVSLRQGNLKRATSMLMESIELRKELGDRGGVAWCLEKLAEVALATEQPLRAAHLLGAAGALRQSLNTQVDIADRADFERTMSSVRRALGEEAYAEAFMRGEAMTFAQVVSYAQEAWEGSEREVTPFQQG